MIDDALIEAMARQIYGEALKGGEWDKGDFLRIAKAALAVARPIIEAPLRAENEKLRAENETHKEIAVRETMNVATLRAALKPFADMLTIEQMQALIGVKDSDWTRAVVTMGDLRAAAAALKETGDE